MSKTLLRHTLIKKYFDIFVDLLIFIHFHYMKIHRLLSSLQRRNIFRQEYKLFKRSNKANLCIALVQQPVSQIKMTFQEFGIIATGPCITNQLRDVNTICRISWYIAAHIWKIHGMFKEVMKDLWLARISSLSNEVGLYVVLLAVLLFMPNSYGT